MQSAARLLTVVVCAAAAGSSLCLAQFVSVAPRVISFAVTADTLISPDRPPGEIIGLAPSPLGIDKVPYKARIEPTNLPSGAPTNFVIVSPSIGVARATAVIALNPKVVPYMYPGVYHLWVFFQNPERPELGSGGVEVYLSFSFPGYPEIASVVNAASLQPGISPGQLVTIRGARLSTPPLTGEADSTGLFPTLLGNSRVTFNGTPAPLLYVSNDQINCVVPYGVAGSRSAQVVVERVSRSGGTLPSPQVTAPVSDTSPAIFTADQSGSGPGSIVNTGAGTGLNTEDNPAPKGTVITFYATGAGTWNLSYPDGSIVLKAAVGLPPPSPEFLAPLAPVGVTIGGQPAKVVAATAQVMRVSGMLQVTAEIPAGVGSGAQPVVLKIGENDNAAQKVTVWVR